MAECQLIDGNNNTDFICGALEGFYGTPWTFEQRKDLFKRLKNLNLNTFMYAPKDDNKHRAKWRQLYLDDEAEQLRILIEEAKLHGIDFYYSLAPGLDIVYSDQDELDCLIRKFDQILGLGCECFAILFDDIEPKINDKDSEIFKDYASAQVTTTNTIYEHLNKPKFLFCPTEYCGSRAVPNVNESPYLNTLGIGLNEGVDIMWSGPRVISRLISEESIEELTKVIRRPPVIWENLHANDYDKRRVFLGPYSGRSTRIIPKLKGVLSNPNCEYEANYIALHTLAQWSRSTQDISQHNCCDPSRVIDENLAISDQIESSVYDPNRALALAIRDWLPRLREPRCHPLGHSNAADRFYRNDQQATVAVSGGSEHIDTSVDMVADESPASAGSTSTSKSCGDMETNAAVPTNDNCESCEMPDATDLSGNNFQNNKSPTGNNETTAMADVSKQANSTGPINRCKQTISFDDISLLVDLFHLPFEHGPQGRKLLRDISWLRDNCELLTSEMPQIKRKDSLSKQVSSLDRLEQASLEEADSDSQDADLRTIDSWNARADSVNFLCNTITRLLDVLIYECPNKPIIGELLPYLLDSAELMAHVLDYVKYLRCRSSSREPFDWSRTIADKTPKDLEVPASEEPEPWVHRGGLMGDIRRLMC